MGLVTHGWQVAGAAVRTEEPHRQPLLVSADVDIQGRPHKVEDDVADKHEVDETIDQEHGVLWWRNREMRRGGGVVDLAVVVVVAMAAAAAAVAAAVAVAVALAAAVVMAVVVAVQRRTLTSSDSTLTSPMNPTWNGVTSCERDREGEVSGCG